MQVADDGVGVGDDLEDTHAAAVAADLLELLAVAAVGGGRGVEIHAESGDGRGRFSRVEPLVVVVRVVHALYVAFVITAPALRWSGAAGTGLGATSGVGRLHLACLGFVTLQFACGWSCPLTRLEEWLAGTGPGSFVVPAVPPVWAWLVLALLWAASLATERAVSGHRAGMEAA